MGIQTCRSFRKKMNGNANLCRAAPSLFRSLALSIAYGGSSLASRRSQEGALCARGPFRRPCRPSRLAARVIPRTIQPITHTTRPCRILCRFSLAGTPLARANARAARTRAAQQRSCAQVHRWCACTARTGAGEVESMQQCVDCGSLCLAMC